jgi:hypothetical protein
MPRAPDPLREPLPAGLTVKERRLLEQTRPITWEDFSRVLVEEILPATSNWPQDAAGNFPEFKARFYFRKLAEFRPPWTLHRLLWNAGQVAWRFRYFDNLLAQFSETDGEYFGSRAWTEWRAAVVRAEDLRRPKEDAEPAEIDPESRALLDRLNAEARRDPGAKFRGKRKGPPPRIGNILKGTPHDSDPGRSPAGDVVPNARHTPPGPGPTA